MATFVIPYTLGDHLASDGLRQGYARTTRRSRKRSWTPANVRERILGVGGNKSVDTLHRELGQIMWNKCGMARNAEGLESAVGDIRSLRDEFWQNVKVLGEGEALNQNLEHAGRVGGLSGVCRTLRPGCPAPE